MTFRSRVCKFSESLYYRRVGNHTSFHHSVCLFSSFRKSFAGFFGILPTPPRQYRMINPLCPRKAPQKKEGVIVIYLNKKRSQIGRNSLYRIGSVDKFSWFAELNHAFLQIIQGSCRARKNSTFHMQRILLS